MVESVLDPAAQNATWRQNGFIKEKSCLILAGVFLYQALKTTRNLSRDGGDRLVHLIETE